MLDIDVVGAQRLVTMSAVDETDFTYLQEALLVAVMEGVPPHWRVKFLSMWAIIAHQLDVKEGLLSEDNEPPF